MSDLTDFLLARIAHEDSTHGTERASERRAMRLIVEDFLTYAADYRAAPSEFAAGRRHAALLAVSRLAETWDYHPDYRQEWRP